MHELEFAQTALVKAGRLVQELKGATAFKRKVDRDIQVPADVQSERLLVSLIQKEFPNDGIYSEEAGLVKKGERNWFIDPLDGTINFANGVPFYCISLSLMQKNKVLATSCYAPDLNELYAAAPGKGCMLGGQKCSVSSKTSLADSIVSTTEGGGKTWKVKETQRVFAKLGTKVRGTRMLGASILMAAWTASGRVDAFVDSSNSQWHRLSSLLVQEAGGKATTFQGRKLNYSKDRESLILANGKVHAELVKALR